jgi:hypothetical protein
MKMMTRPSSRRVLRWIFRRGNHLLTCQLTKIFGNRYVLSLVPHWDREHGDTETFESGLSALHRHAIIAKSLRDAGWKVVAYTGPSPFTPDYQALLARRAA